MAEPDSGSAEPPVIRCKRCQVGRAALRVRADDVCGECFAQYVTTKAVKRMETYRVRGSTKSSKRLLLPLSFGPCSASLLYILDQHLQGQVERMNRTAYELFIVHVDVFLDEHDRKASAEALVRYSSRFPRHKYLKIGLEEALHLGNINWRLLGISEPSKLDSAVDATQKLQELLSSLPSSTSKSDVASTLLSRLLVDIAGTQNCEAILFGDSATRLAERTLTETAKGRGISLPWQVSDGISPTGVGYNYPLRDLLKKELVTFSALPGNLFSNLVSYETSGSHISASSKSTTIDDLMAQYFESVEENYPSIVANVVRTSSKLRPLPIDGHGSCGLCGLPVQAGPHGVGIWAGDQDSATRSITETDGLLCYGCSRSINS